MSRQMDFALLYLSLAGAESDESEELNVDRGPVETESHIESSRETRKPIQLGESDMSEGDINTRNGFFDFFKLPRELRDKIYDLLYVRDSERRACVPRESLHRDGFSPHLTITAHSTVPQAFLLNHRFKSEYVERSEIPIIINRTILHTDIPLCGDWYPNQSCPPFAQKATLMEVRLKEPALCVWCHGQFVLRPGDLKPIARFAAHMPALERIRLHIYFPGESHGDWTCKRSRQSFPYWDGARGLNYAVESLACGSPPCWSARPHNPPSLEIYWYCWRGRGLPEAVQFCKWTQEDGLQLDLSIAR